LGGLAVENTAWWKSIAALLGVAIPAATVLQGWLQRDRELALQDRQQRQELRLAYMNVLTEGGLEGLALVADFAARTEQDVAIKTWAQELSENATAKAEAERAQLVEQQKQLAAAEELLRVAEDRVRDAEAKAAEAAARALADREAKQAAEVAQKAADSARKESAKANADARVAKERVAQSKETLLGRQDVTQAGPIADVMLGERVNASANAVLLETHPALSRLRPAR
jgi:hypothetical protein